MMINCELDDSVSSIEWSIAEQSLIDNWNSMSAMPSSSQSPQPLVTSSLGKLSEDEPPDFNMNRWDSSTSSMSRWDSSGSGRFGVEGRDIFPSSTTSSSNQDADSHRHHCCSSKSGNNSCDSSNSRSSRRSRANRSNQAAGVVSLDSRDHKRDQCPCLIRRQITLPDDCSDNICNNKNLKARNKKDQIPSSVHRQMTKDV